MHNRASGHMRRAAYSDEERQALIAALGTRVSVLARRIERLEPTSRPDLEARLRAELELVRRLLDELKTEVEVARPATNRAAIGLKKRI